MGFIKSSIIVLITALLVKWLPSLLKSQPLYEEHGYVAPGWEKVAHAFRYSLVSGLENGGSLSVWYKNKMVIDLWGGSADDDALWEMEESTIFQMFSSTKAISATLAAILVDRGYLDYTAPVSKYWPEFAQNGKAEITVEQLLSHQAGLAAVDVPLKLKDATENSQQFSDMLARQTPEWTPGEGHGYHTMTFALYIDELVKRADPKHRNLKEMFNQEIRDKYNLDMFFGLPKSEFYRSARIRGTAAGLDMNILGKREYWPLLWQIINKGATLSIRSIFNPHFGPNMELMNNPRHKMNTCGSSHGFGTARALAKFYAILANDGELEGKRLLSKATIERLIEPMSQGHDLVLLYNNTFTRGFSEIASVTGSMTYGTPGAGGQVGWFDPVHDLAVGYLTNHHTTSFANDASKYEILEQAIYDTVSELENYVK